MNCEKITELIDFYVEKELDKDVMEKLDSHFSSCKSCSSELLKYKKLFSVIDEIDFEDEKLPSDFTHQVMKRLPASENISIIDSITGFLRKFIIPVSSLTIVILLLILVFPDAVKKPKNIATTTIQKTTVSKQEKPLKIASLQILTEGTFQINREGILISASEKENDQIFKNDRLISENAKLEVNYDSMRKIVIGNNSELTFLSDGIALHKGAIRAKVKSNGTTFSVKTDNATIKVTGTDFIVIQNNMHQTIVSLFSGRLNISNNNNSVNITSGQKAIIENPFDNIIVQVLKELKKIKITKEIVAKPPVTNNKTNTSESSSTFPPDTVEIYDDLYDQLDGGNTQGAGGRIR